MDKLITSARAIHYIYSYTPHVSVYQYEICTKKARNGDNTPRVWWIDALDNLYGVEEATNVMSQW